MYIRNIYAMGISTPTVHMYISVRTIMYISSLKFG
jgi:hypothetical protein